MKRLLSIFVLLLILLPTFAQDNNIAIKAMVPDGQIPAEATSNLETRLQRMLSQQGIADVGYTPQFILAAKVDVISKDVAPTTPPRISQKLEITLLVIDVLEKKVHGSVTQTVAGIGINENKAFISAFTKLNPKNADIQRMIADAKEAIKAYYTNNAASILARNKTLAAQGQYDEAISYLLSVPDVNHDTYQQCQSLAQNIYKQKLDVEGKAIVAEARKVWMQGRNTQSASEAASILTQVNVNSSAMADAKKLQQEMSAKLSADDRRAWQLKMQAIKAQQETTRTFINGCKEVALAFASSRPKTIYKIVRSIW